MHNEALVASGASDAGGKAEELRAFREINAVLIGGEGGICAGHLHILIVAVIAIEILIARAVGIGFIIRKDAVLPNVVLRIDVDVRIRRAESRLLLQLLQCAEHGAVLHVMAKQEGIAAAEVMRTQTVIKDGARKIALPFEGLMQIIRVVRRIYHRILHIQYRNIKNTGEVRIGALQCIVVDLQCRIIARLIRGQCFCRIVCGVRTGSVILLAALDIRRGQRRVFILRALILQIVPHIEAAEDAHGRQRKHRNHVKKQHPDRSLLFFCSFLHFHFTSSITAAGPGALLGSLVWQHTQFLEKRLMFPPLQNHTITQPGNMVTALRYARQVRKMQTKSVLRMRSISRLSLFDRYDLVSLN